MKKKQPPEPYFTGFDSYLFHNGTNYESYRKLGAHVRMPENSGTMFALWAPGARSVSVITESGGWDENAGVMEKREGGIWERFLPGVRSGELYRFVVTGADGVKRYKSDPYAFCTERRPGNASRVARLQGYEWQDNVWMTARHLDKVPVQPMSVYEVHLGSWKKDFGRTPDGFLNYRELGNQLADYLEYMGYTHVELIGICEHPFDGSWGYQVTGFFSPTSRYGAPDDFRYFVDVLHRRGIGVILDWVPAHFPRDSFGLCDFDGTALYESSDPLRAEYPEWGTKAFDFGRPEVRSFLISSAFYWVREFHVDALRVDAVAAILYNSFGRTEWRPNSRGGTENDEGIAFLKQLNHAVKTQTGAYLIAEDSSIVEGVTKSEEEGGLGFMFKWNMGWMNDTLKYVETDPVFRTHEHDRLTHTIDYAFLENWVLVLSHDEVVHLKHSMLEKFPGTYEDRLNGLKTLYAFQYTAPGKKLLFMGQEFAEDREWDENRSINWEFAANPEHRDVMRCVKELNAVYRKYAALHADAKDGRTFEWVNRCDADRNILAYIRRNPWNYDGALLVICSFSPVEHHDYTCGVPVAGMYRQVFSTYDFRQTVSAHYNGNFTGDTDHTDLTECTAKIRNAGDDSEHKAGLSEPLPLITANERCDEHPYRLMYSLRPYESIILEFPELPETTAIPETKEIPETKALKTGSANAMPVAGTILPATGNLSAKGSESATDKLTGSTEPDGSCETIETAELIETAETMDSTSVTGSGSASSRTRRPGVRREKRSRRA